MALLVLNNYEFYLALTFPRHLRIYLDTLLNDCSNNVRELVYGRNVGKPLKGDANLAYAASNRQGHTQNLKKTIHF